MTRHFSNFARAVACLLILLATLTTASAQNRANSRQVIDLSEVMNMLTQRITKEVLLVALGDDSERHMLELEASRALFNRTRTAFRQGDDDLMLPRATNPLVLRELDEVDRLWTNFDMVVQDIIDSGAATEAQVRMIAELNLPLLDATEAAMKELLYDVVGGRSLVSVLDVAIEETGHQRLRSQTLAKELLLIIYGENPELHRGHLAEQISLFDRTLQGLIHGDLEMQLLPAFTPEIESQMRRIERSWAALRPIVAATAAGDTPDDMRVSEAARQSLVMMQELHTAIQIYGSL